MRPALFLALALAPALLAACSNPVEDARIAALGPEDPAVPPSDVHRPGQPCLLCHGPYKGASPEMVVAGTIYGYAYDSDNKTADPIPVEGASVELHDAYGDTPINQQTNKKLEIKTNCAGNFYVTKDEWNPGFPLSVALTCPDGMMGLRVPMTSRISRDGSCAGCHDGNPDFKAHDGEAPGPNQGTPGWVYCTQPGPGAPSYTAPDVCAPTQGNGM